MPVPGRGLELPLGTPRLWRGVLAALVVAVCALAFLPAPPQELSTGWDKLNHALAFACLAAAARFGFPTRRAPVAIVPALLAFGALIELVQAFVPGRAAEGADLLGDAVGIAIGLLAAQALLRSRRGAART